MLKLLASSSLALALSAASLACGGTTLSVAPDSGPAPDASTPDAGPPDATPDAPPDAAEPVVTQLDAVPDRAVVKIRPTAGGWIALEEQLAPWSSPAIDPERRRTLVWKAADAGGVREIRRLTLTADALISDFVVHPSGAVTAIVTGRTTTENLLYRIDASGAVVAMVSITDPDLATDPAPFGQDMGISRPLELRCVDSRIAASIDAIGEDVAVSFETGGHAVVLHRYRFEEPGNFVKVWRRLVEPAAYLLAFGGTINRSTFDTGDHQAGAHRATLAVGESVIAVVAGDTFAGERLDAHNAFFGDALPESPGGALLVTRFALDGTRLGTTVVPGFFESIGRGAIVFKEELYVVGVGGSPRADGFGLDGRIADVRVANGKLRWANNIDVHRSDWLMDVALTPRGEILVAGMSGFWRNDQGISFGEESEPLLAQLDSEGHLLRRIAIPAGPRNNQVRSVSLVPGGALLGGFSNGPGTHSGDDDPARIKADGAVWRLTFGGR